MLAHLLGMAFNYVSYSQHVFRTPGQAKLRFILSYGVNYLLSLSTLGLVSLSITSPYLAGFASAVIVSLINYFLLKYFVFRSLSK